MSRRVHVERVERRALRGVPGDVHGAEAAAREAKEQRDGVVEEARRVPREREQAAARGRLHRFHGPRQRDLQINIVARELEENAPARARVGEPPGRNVGV